MGCKPIGSSQFSLTLICSEQKILFGSSSDTLMVRLRKLTTSLSG